MPSSAETLPVELWQIIIRNMGSNDLRQLRRVNSTFKILATPAVFENITRSAAQRNYGSRFTHLTSPNISDLLRFSKV